MNTYISNYLQIATITIIFAGLNYIIYTKKNINITIATDILIFIIIMLIVLSGVKFIPNIDNDIIKYAQINISTSLTTILYSILTILHLNYLKILTIYNESQKNFNIEHEAGKLKIIALIILFFLSVKILFIFLFNGNFIDEYLHIFSAIDIVDKGSFATYYRPDDPFGRGGEYNKGGILILLMSSMFYLFGPSLIIAKITSALIGFFCFCILLYITRDLFIKNYIRYITFIFITLSPAIIFNHLYTRVYLVYELILMLNLLLIKLLHEKKYLYSGYLILFSFIYQLFFFDIKTFPCFIPIAVYIFYKFPLLNFKNKKILYLEFIALLVAINILGFGTPESIVESSNFIGFYTYFFKLNLFISVLFIISSIYFYIKSKSVDYRFILITSSFTIFIFHLSLNENIQYLRTIFYLTGLIFISVGLLIDDIQKLNTKYNKFLYIPLFFTLCINYIYFIYPYPHIPNEVDYINYKDISNKAKEICSTVDVIAAINSPFIPNLFGLNIDKTVYVRQDLLENDGRYIKRDRDYYSYYGDIKVINDNTVIKNMVSNNANFCLIIGKNYKDSSRFIEKETFDSLDKNIKYIDFDGNLPLRLYYNINNNP